MSDLSEKELMVLQYIDESIKKNGYPPTTREIGARITSSSSSTPHIIIHSLVKKGFLAKEPRIPRAITLTLKAHSTLFGEEREVLRTSISILEYELKHTKKETVKRALETAIKTMEEKF